MEFAVSVSFWKWPGEGTHSKGPTFVCVVTTPMQCMCLCLCLCLCFRFVRGRDRRGQNLKMWECIEMIIISAPTMNGKVSWRLLLCGAQLPF